MCLACAPLLQAWSKGGELLFHLPSGSYGLYMFWQEGCVMDACLFVLVVFLCFFLFPHMCLCTCLPCNSCSQCILVNVYLCISGSFEKGDDGSWGTVGGTKVPHPRRKNNTRAYPVTLLTVSFGRARSRATSGSVCRCFALWAPRSVHRTLSCAPGGGPLV